MEAHVVVVDDEPELLKLVCEVLEEDGYTVDGFAHPESLLFQEHRLYPDLVLLDLMLPSRTGIQLARELRKDGMAHTPMVAMSASHSLLCAAAESGLFHETIRKPFDLSELLNAVGRFVEQRQTA